MANIHRIGDGTRPTTDGGVDNIGAAGSFTPGQADTNAPGPKERMTEKKRDKASVKADDSAPLDLKASTATDSNTEPASSNPGRQSNA